MTHPLISAIYREDAAMVAKLLNNDAIANVDEDGRTALMHAILAETPNVGIIKMLLDAGSAVDHRDRQGWTALHFAARDQNRLLVEILLRAGAPIETPDIYGNTPLWRAVMNKTPKLEIVRVLLRAGASPHTVNKSGVSPLDIARRMANRELEAVLSSDGRSV